MNQIMVLDIYKYGAMWAFDDESRGLLREPFIAGIDKMLTRIAEGSNGLTVAFSARHFPLSNYTLVRGALESGGAWYYCEQLGMKGWLCPALFKFFAKAPKEIHLKVEVNHNKEEK